METDNNPSVVVATFGTQKGIKEFLKRVDNRKGMRIREVRLFDIGIPLDDNFDDNVNFLKSGSMPILSGYLDMIPMASMLWNKLYKARKFQKFDYSKKWETDVKNPMIFAGITPLFVDMKYVDTETYTKEESEKCKRLVSFDTPNYKPDRSAIAKNQKDVGVWENVEEV